MESMSVHILDAMSRSGFEEVVAIHHEPSGMRAFLGIHDTSVGPAFGGIRRWAYVDERRALMDCLRLARSMTMKCALAGLNAGGAKVVLLDGPELDREQAYRHLGRIVHRRGGAFYTGPDVGTGAEELAWVAAETDQVTKPGDDGPGNLSLATARGVFAGIESALRHVDGEADWARRRVVVQGLGGVGYFLAKRLRAQGATVIAAEIDEERAAQVAEELDLELVEPGTEFDVECDVFSPCALGGVVHDVTLRRLRAKVVAGGANNVLAKTLHGDRLHERGVIYVPDFVINTGALIRGALFHMTGKPESLDAIEARIGACADRILAEAAAEQEAPVRVAEREADRIIAERRGQELTAPEPV